MHQPLLGKRYARKGLERKALLLTTIENNTVAYRQLSCRCNPSAVTLTYGFWAVKFDINRNITEPKKLPLMRENQNRE